HTHTCEHTHTHTCAHTPVPGLRAEERHCGIIIPWSVLPLPLSVSLYFSVSLSPVLTLTSLTTGAMLKWHVGIRDATNTLTLTHTHSHSHTTKQTIIHH